MRMLRQNLRSRSAIALILGLSLACFATFAQADGDRGENHRHGNYKHRHHDGRWYAHDEIIVHSAPSIQVNI